MKHFVKNLIGVTSFSFCLFLLTGFELDRSVSEIKYVLQHPFHKTEAISKNFDCFVTLSDSTKTLTKVFFSVSLDSFDSGNESRDSHMLELTEGLLYPKAVFESKQITSQDSVHSVQGLLQFHGVSKLITLRVVSKNISPKLIRFMGRMSFKLADFKIERPVLLLVPSSSEFEFSFSIYFKI